MTGTKSTVATHSVQVRVEVVVRIGVQADEVDIVESEVVQAVVGVARLGAVVHVVEYDGAKDGADDDRGHLDLSERS